MNLIEKLRVLNDLSVVSDIDIEDFPVDWIENQLRVNGFDLNLVKEDIDQALKTALARRKWEVKNEEQAVEWAVKIRKGSNPGSWPMYLDVVIDCLVKAVLSLKRERDVLKTYVEDEDV